MVKRLLLLTALVLLVPALVVAGPITAVYVFGDSLSDGGNAFIRTGGLFPLTPPYAQRLSNGPVAVERLAADMGVALTPSFAGGTNYAVAGAATGQVPIPATPNTTDNYITVASPALAPFFAGLGIDAEVSTFVGSPPVFNPNTSLFVLWGGPNDFFINPSAATASAAVGNLSGELQALYGAGARNFLVPNMPDLSMTPSGRSQLPAVQLGLHNLTVGFNGGLKSALDVLSSFPGINITQFDTFSLFNAIVANPAAYGFTDVIDPCLTLAVCATPDEFLFWDSVHPTAAADRILGDAFAAAVEPVPEPATMLLLGTGIAGVLVRARRRRT